MSSALSWTKEEVAALRAQWVDNKDGSFSFPDGSWPECLAEPCTNRCSLKYLSKLCHPCTLKAQAQGES